MISNSDMKYLKRCVELARKALEKGDLPFGSVLVSKDDTVLAAALGLFKNPGVFFCLIF